MHLHGPFLLSSILLHPKLVNGVVSRLWSVLCAKQQGSTQFSCSELLLAARHSMSVRGMICSTGCVVESCTYTRLHYTS